MTLSETGEEAETMEVDESQEDGANETKRKVYLPHKHGAGQDVDELVMETSAYRFYYPLSAECSSLSFDFLTGSIAPAPLAVVTQESSDKMKMQYPLSMYFVSGSQAQQQHSNILTIVKMTNICGKDKSESETADDDSSSSSSDDESDDDDKEVGSESKNDGAKGAGGRKAHLTYTTIPHHGTVNRVRSCRYTTSMEAQLVATWSEAGAVHIWNLQPAVVALDQFQKDSSASDAAKQDNSSGAGFVTSSNTADTERVDLPPSVMELVKRPLFSYRPHAISSSKRSDGNEPVEGYALDWSASQAGWLASGDVHGNIHIWQPQSSGSGSTWQVTTPLQQGHTDSVEDIQWAPSQPNVLISCSCDSSILVWDLRTGGRPAIRIPQASLRPGVDLNVLSWNKVNEALLLSGDDAGGIRLWDLRRVNEEQRLGSSGNLNMCFLHEYQYHKSAITSIEWHPTETHTFACSSEDDQVTLWDCSIEQAGAGDANMDDADLNELPPQLLFIHMGQKEVKELHWHPKHSGLIMSTAVDGYNVFRTINV